MKTLTKVSFTLAVLLTVQSVSDAQVSIQRLQEDPNRAGCLFHSYEFMEIKDSEAPKGYKPFYVSHYGRHGSRYHTDSSTFIGALQALNHAYSIGNLTDEGEKMRAYVNEIHQAHKGMWGHLTEKGVEEQKALAERLFERVPEVFNDKKRNIIDSYSSDIPRCILSLASFTGRLIAGNPSLDVRYETGARCSEYLRCGPADVNVKAYYFPQMHEEIEKSCDWSSAVKIFFKDPSKLEITPYQFADNLWGAWAICQCIGFDKIEILKYLSQEQLCNIWNYRSHYYYLLFVRSDKFGETAVNKSKGLLRDFLSKADEALKGDGTAATIRFGHDSTLMPFAGLLGIDGFHAPYSTDNSPTDKWDLGTHVCMGSSVQMIFYKNRNEDILVKFIYNEQEKTVPALKPVHGKYYYDWETVREYLTVRAR